MVTQYQIVAIGSCSGMFRKATIVGLVTIMVDNYTTAGSTNVIVDHNGQYNNNIMVSKHN